MRSRWTTFTGWSAAVLLAVGFALCVYNSGRGAIAFSTPYQAVLLSNGSVYYGKLQGYHSANPILTDVFYILSETNPETKQKSNVLVKRGKELHSPDRMYLTPSQIMFVEPVAADSKIAQLISEASH